MIELKMSNGQYLRQEDLELFLNNYEEYFIKNKKDLLGFQFADLVNENCFYIKEQINKFDEIELIVIDVSYFKEISTETLFGREWGSSNTEVLKSENKIINDFVSGNFYKKERNKKTKENYENKLTNVYGIYFSLMFKF